MLTHDIPIRDRRRDPRRLAGWPGFYRLPGQPGAGWAQCRVLDISTSGVGLELFGPPWPPDGHDAELVVRFDGTGTADVPGVIRNVAASRFGFVRVGVEFTGLTPEARLALDALLEHELACTAPRPGPGKFMP
ncbi:MAG TPA: PilZ domain-containing protein [Acidimicrobiia bacterium]|nr:PilZ domain-containing protein [Acidimicrobiia bacterium]